MRNSTHADARAAIDAALAAAPAWQALSFDDRAAIFLKAADLLAGPWRATLNAATMLGQSKTVIQAEIDSACELVDFWRFNVQYGRRLLAEQPASSPGVWNRMDHRPLEGFVYAITPFNFTAIAGNLPTVAALMGNVVVWKPSSTQQFAAHFLMRLLEEAGLPPGVINMVPGDGIAVSETALRDPHLAGIHFTGSTQLFQRLWRTVGENIAGYRSYPRLVGETGGKDFVIAHPSADAGALRTALVRGAFEYQGQKCSAASRAYLPRSVWNRVRDPLLDEVDSLSVGDVTDFSNFMGAVIDGRAFARHAGVLQRAAGDPALTVAAGGGYDDSTGWFVRPLPRSGGMRAVRLIQVYFDTAFPQVSAVRGPSGTYLIADPPGPVRVAARTCSRPRWKPRLSSKPSPRRFAGASTAAVMMCGCSYCTVTDDQVHPFRSIAGRLVRVAYGAPGSLVGKVGDPLPIGGLACTTSRCSGC
jgi:1-pyrroline-5-carboxylate dehydrogenase